MNGGGELGGIDFGSLTPEQRQYIMEKLGDLTGQEDAVQRQFAQANALRTPPPQGRDWGSQAARAISGIDSAMNRVLAAKAQGELGGKYRTFGREFGMLGRRRPEEMAGMFAGAEDLWGRS